MCGFPSLGRGVVFVDHHHHQQQQQQQIFKIIYMAMGMGMMRIVSASTLDLLCFSQSYSLPFLQPQPQSQPWPRLSKPMRCTPLQQQQLQVDAGILCDPCNGRGWLLCDFCKGQKTNVKSENSRIYRRCPSCRAIGYTLCSNCKVFKCVTFPDYSDGEETTF